MTGQELSIVSDTRGTTTDPVQKAMELLPLGPVVIIDTPGLDDGTELGRLRIERTMQMMRKTDIAVIVTDTSEKDEETESFIEKSRIKVYPLSLSETNTILWKLTLKETMCFCQRQNRGKYR